MGAGNMGYPDIRISAFEIFGFFRIFGSYSHNFQGTMLKLCVNDHFMVADVLGNRIFGYRHPDFLDIWPLKPYFEN